MNHFSLLKYFINPFRRISYRTFSTMPMERPWVDAMRNQRLSRKDRDSNTTANNFFFQIIGNSSSGSPCSILVSSENQSYLFNCGEGFQRLAFENKVRLTKLEHIFVTSLEWGRISGVFGTSLTLHDMGSPKLCLHGPDGIDSLFTSIRGFVDQSVGSLKNWTLSTRNSDEGDFEDSGLSTKYIQLKASEFENDNSMNHHHLFKKQKSDKIFLAYVCKVPDLAGALDIDKCKKFNVPIGPKLGMLKQGKDITLENGTLIRSSDVVGQAKPGPLFIVLECPSPSYIPSLVKNPEILSCATLRQTEISNQVSFIVHYCPDSVLRDERYISWMKMFPSDCKHVVMNGSNDPINFMAIHRMQTQLNLLDSQLFPLFADNIKNVTDRDNNKSLTMLIRPSNLDKFQLRPFESFEAIEHKIDTESYLQEAYDVGGFKENLENLKQLQETFKSEQNDPNEPELIFFGTGSSMPSKLRNCSCIYLKMSAKDSMIMDCGEGSFGQMVRFFGASIKDKLTNLKLIFISHYHADHHLGLIELIRQRKNYTDDPLSLIVPPQINVWLEHYCQKFEDLSPYYRLYFSHTFESMDEIRTTSRKLWQHSSRTKDKYERSSPSPPRARGDGLDSGQKKQLLDRLPIFRDIQLIKVRHCPNSYAIAININLPSSRNYSLAYSGDAMPSDEFVSRAKGCDLLIHEATLQDDLDAEARLKRHSTFSQAIDVGRRMEAKFTLLTHFSQRYSKIPLFNENFDDLVGFAFDNMRIRLPSDLKRIPILKSALSALFYEHIEMFEDRRERAMQKQEMIAKYIDEHGGAVSLNSKEVLQKISDFERDKPKR